MRQIWAGFLSKFCIVLSLAVVPNIVLSEDNPSAYDAKVWDTTKPRGKTHTIDFTTREGTWMSVDLSPDGSRIVFDLLAQIYVVNANGGDAKPLTQDSGIAINYQPRWSPDGKSIVFISDRGGQEALWLMNGDGSEPRLVFQDFFSRITEPSWAPDGKSIIATRRRNRPLGFYEFTEELWRFSLSGAEPQKISLGDDVSIDVVVGAAETSADGHYLYFHQSQRGQAQFSINRLTLADGLIEQVTSPVFKPEYGVPRPGEIAPKPSPDGRMLAFGRSRVGSQKQWRGANYGPRMALWVRDLRDGTERVLHEDVNTDATLLLFKHKRRILPDYNWSHDSKSLLLTIDGKIVRLDVRSNAVKDIPFNARVQRVISEQARARHSVKGRTFEVRNPRWPATSPDQRETVFEAAGRLWLLDRATGETRRLTGEADDASAPLELTPIWSGDGQSIIYASWSDKDKGHLWSIPRTGGKPNQLTSEPGRYLYPHFAQKQFRASRWPIGLTGSNGDPFSNSWELIANEQGKWEVLKSGSPLADGGGDAAGNIRTVSWQEMTDDANDAKSTQSAKIKTQIGTVSPDGKNVAYISISHVWLATSEQAEQLSKAEKPIGIKLSASGAYFVRWQSTGTLEWFEANQLVTYDVRSKRKTVSQVKLYLPRDYAPGSVAISNARIVTLDKDRRVIENGTIIIRDGRIASVGPSSEVKPGANDHVINAQGKTIVPGWFDMHSHQIDTSAGSDVLNQQNSMAAGYIAHGVTTVYEPGLDIPESAFPIIEQTAAGRRVGPRFFAAGQYLYDWPGMRAGLIEELTDYNAVKAVVDRQVARGAVQLKDYRLPNRIQRQMITEIARDRGLSVTNEGDGLEAYLAMIMDGSTGMEHWLQYYPTYADVTTFVGKAEIHYSPQLWFADYNNGPSDRYWLGVDQPWKNAKLRRFVSSEFLATTVVQPYPLESFAGPFAAQTALDIKKAGGRYVVGAHSQMPGADVHYEMWTYGFAAKPIEVLYAASLDAAHMLGLENELGSLEAGKIADLVVLNSNILEDIRRSRDIQYVMKDGRLYDGETASEVWPRQRPFLTPTNYERFFTQ
jgi:Tol biopolymer transport system component/imidazolonepropionase-like amidohydrolase